MSLDDAPGAERASVVPPSLGYTTIAFVAIVGGFVIFATGHELPRPVHLAAMYVLPVAAVALIVAWGVVRIDRHTDERVRVLEAAVAANREVIAELRLAVGELRGTLVQLSARLPAGRRSAIRVPGQGAVMPVGLERSEYWNVYADALEDLSAVDQAEGESEG